MSRRILLALIVLLAGCGGSEVTAPTTTAPPTVAVPSFAANTAMARIQQAGRLKVGTRFDQAGFSLRNTQSQMIEGFDVEIAKLIAQRLFGGTVAEAAGRIDYVETVPLNRASFIENGTVDIVVSTYAMNDLRNERVDFAGPYYVARGDILVAADSTTRSLGDLNGRAVCAQTGSIYEQALRQAAPQASILGSPNLAGCLVQMREGAAVATLGDSVVLAGLVQANADAFELVGTSYAETPYGVGVRNDDIALRDFVGRVIVDIGRTGDLTRAFEATLARLGLPTPTPPVVTAPTTMAPTTTSAVPTTAVTVAPPR